MHANDTFWNSAKKRCVGMFDFIICFANPFIGEHELTWLIYLLLLVIGYLYYF